MRVLRHDDTTSSSSRFFHRSLALAPWSPAQAVEKARSLALQAVIASREHQFDTVLGRIGFDDKSDITTPCGTWYVWEGGEHVPLA